MTLLDFIKSSLRISTTCTDFDGEISDLISQAKADLGASGVLSSVLEVSPTDDISGIDANIKRLILLYCKAFFGLDNPDKDWYLTVYKYNKGQMMNQVQYVGDNDV